MGGDSTIIHAGSGEPPLHGYRGDRAGQGELGEPSDLTVTISREVGARGGSIARRAAEALGWQVYSQELLEYMAANESARAELIAELPEAAFAWVDERLRELRDRGRLNPETDMGELPRIVLLLAVRGRVVLLGRGAGFLLPSRTTLHVRVVAPESARVGYMEQWLRLSRAEAEQQVRQRDMRRAEFLRSAFGPAVSDPITFDLVLNSARLGAESCVELVAAAARAKQASLVPEDVPTNDEGIDPA